MIFARGDRVQVASGVGSPFEGCRGEVIDATCLSGVWDFDVCFDSSDTGRFKEGELLLVELAADRAAVEAVTADVSERLAIVEGNHPAHFVDSVSGAYVTKDSGQREHFPTGMVRDQGAGKGRYDLIPREALHRLAQLYERGAEKYDARNWELGQPFSRAICSMLRHAFQASAGMDDEDHLAAVVFNAFAVMTYQERIAAGLLPPELDDLP